MSTTPDPVQQVAVSVAADIVWRLIQAGGYPVKKRFSAEPRRAALNTAVGEALATTIEALTDDPDRMTHYLQIFGEWAQQDAVAGELSQLVDPRENAKLDLDLLREEFEALGYAPELLGEGVSFDEVAVGLAAAFREAADRQPELADEIQIDLLHRLVDQAQQQIEQTDRIVRAVAPDLTDEDRRYLGGLRERLNYLPLGGEARDTEPGSERREITLRKVYVTLETTGTVEEPVREDEGEEAAGGMRIVEAEGRRVRQRPETALEALAARRSMVLLGEPGSGKTTFLRHVALTCADIWLGIGNGDLGPLAELGERLFPLVVTLRRWARDLDPDAEPSADVLLDHLFKQLGCKHAHDTYWQTVRQRMLDGEAILLLDGYDEVDVAQRGRVADIVRSFVGQFADVPVLITCRIRAYEDEATPRLHAAPVVLDGLRPERIREFAVAWYDEMVRLDRRYTGDWASTRTSELLNAIGDSDRLSDMARNPLLLTMMARVNARRPLPDSRAELYGEVLDQLLWEWERRKWGRDAEPGLVLKDLLNETGKNEKHFLFWLAAFTFEQHIEQGAEREIADIPASALRKALREFHGGEPPARAAWAVKVVDMVSRRNGVLLWQGDEDETLTFPHRSFQEYLAAIHMARSKEPREVAELARSGDHWHEVALLNAGYLAQQTAQQGLALQAAQEMFPEIVGEESDWIMVKLAAEAVDAVGADLARDSKLGQQLLSQVSAALVDLLETGALTPVERVSAGDTLARLGDPRFDGPCGLPEDLESYFARIEGGSFTMGTTDKELAEIKAGAEWYAEQSENWDTWLDWEQPDHPVTVDDFRIGHYLITNAQYEAFIDAGGYGEAGLERWWTPAGREAWRGGHIERWTPEGWVASDTLPGRWPDRRLNARNAPVVGVSWFEAVAYCNWLTDALRDMGHLDGDHVVRLPTEPEWEYAAGGPTRCTYPWGNDWNPDALNWAGGGIGRPSAVGAFPAGATPATGLLDMAGNVWQWCQSRWGDYPYEQSRESLDSERQEGLYEPRCVRGSSWANVPGDARCAARYGFDANYGSLNRAGFRVVLSHLS